MSGAALRRTVGLLVPWILLGLTVWLVVSQIRNTWALFDLWRTWAEIGILAFGMTAIILTGGIDLSVGSIVALSGMVLGILWKQYDWPIAWASAAAVFVGFLAGACNGALVVAGISPLVATLATMAFYAGLAMAISGGERVAGLPRSFTWIGQGDLWGLPVQLYVLAAIFVLLGLVVHATRFGRYLFAIGDNRRAAAFAAVPVRWVEGGFYALNGLLAGIVALLYTARGSAAVPDPSPGMELQVIACVILGGTRVTGGEGSIGRTLLGLAILAHLDRGLRLLGGRTFHVPWSDAPWRFTTDARLILIGLAVIAVAIWNEKVVSRRLR